MALDDCTKGKLQEDYRGVSLASRLACLEEGMRKLAHNQVVVDEHINAKLKVSPKELTGKSFIRASPASSSAQHMVYHRCLNVGSQAAHNLIKTEGPSSSLSLLFLMMNIFGIVVYGFEISFVFSLNSILLASLVITLSLWGLFLIINFFRRVVFRLSPTLHMHSQFWDNCLIYVIWTDTK